MTNSQIGDAFHGRSVKRSIPIREQVADMIRDAITSQQFKPGDLLIERELCEGTGASRTTVREALRQLESEGLIESVAGRGSTVIKLSVDDARNIYEIRAALEGLAGKLFVERATDQEVRRLEAVVDEIEESSGDVRALLSNKAQFYEILFEGARNPELTRVIGLMHRRITLLRARSLSVPNRMEGSISEIREILAAIKSRDPQKTYDSCVEHVEAAARAAFLGMEAASTE